MRSSREVHYSNVTKMGKRGWESSASEQVGDITLKDCLNIEIFCLWPLTPAIYQSTSDGRRLNQHACPKYPLVLGLFMSGSRFWLCSLEPHCYPDMADLNVNLIYYMEVISLLIWGLSQRMYGCWKAGTQILFTCDKACRQGGITTKGPLIFGCIQTTPALQLWLKTP